MLDIEEKLQLKYFSCHMFSVNTNLRRIHTEDGSRQQKEQWLDVDYEVGGEEVKRLRLFWQGGHQQISQ